MDQVHATPVLLDRLLALRGPLHVFLAPLVVSLIPIALAVIYALLGLIQLPTDPLIVIAVRLLNGALQVLLAALVALQESNATWVILGVETAHMAIGQQMGLSIVLNVILVSIPI